MRAEARDAGRRQHGLRASKGAGCAQAEAEAEVWSSCRQRCRVCVAGGVVCVKVEASACAGRGVGCVQAEVWAVCRRRREV